MDNALLLLILRFVGAGALLAFMGVLMWLLYRDIEVTAAALEAKEQPQGFLLVLATEAAGVAAGTRLPLLPVTGIGRDQSNTLMLDDAYTSGEHLLITLRSGRWWAEDLGSRNGTLLNGQALTTTAVVSVGDVLTVGSTSLKVEL